jgi:hypothetical protein
MSELITENLVLLNKAGVITVGISDRGVHKLLGAPEDNVFEDYKKQLTESAENFVDSAKGMPLTIAKDNMKNLDNLMIRSLSEWTLEEFASLFIITYISVYQQTYRSLTGKERGQLNHLVRNYQASVLFKMIVHYVFQSDKYGKVISFGLFLHSKDTIYERVTEKSKVAVKMNSMRKRSSRDDEQSFV